MNEELKQLLPIEESEVEYAAATEYQGQAIMFFAELRSKIEELETSRYSTVAATATTTLRAPDPVCRMRASRSLKLNITSFRGDITHWRSEQFEGTIHSNQALSTTDKFYHLHRYMTGDAAVKIEGLTTTETCYADAIQLLKQRFGDQRRIEQGHLMALQNLLHVQSSTDTQGMRNLYDTAQLNIRALKALNGPTFSFAATLRNTLMTSMPYDIVVQYHKQIASKLPINGATAQVDATS
ncbi:uncharacterized protein LOC120846026 [Ixodes scapularis]|uniref:uncharacterized protein LOC120846026 n=1 Tax=Ixodes scapularis TaxID=6945 RepID=UPI001A9EF032|nr:uncharacterized protein LOC120846026 [Ixodes scapularis]